MRSKFKMWEFGGGGYRTNEPIFKRNDIDGTAPVFLVNPGKSHLSCPWLNGIHIRTYCWALTDCSYWRFCRHSSQRSGMKQLSNRRRVFRIVQTLDTGSISVRDGCASKCWRPELESSMEEVSPKAGGMQPTTRFRPGTFSRWENFNRAFQTKCTTVLLSKVQDVVGLLYT